MIKKLSFQKDYLVAIANCILVMYLMSCNPDEGQKDGLYHNHQASTIEIGNEKVKAVFYKR